MLLSALPFLSGTAPSFAFLEAAFLFLVLLGAGAALASALDSSSRFVCFHVCGSFILFYFILFYFLIFCFSFFCLFILFFNFHSVFILFPFFIAFSVHVFIMINIKKFLFVFLFIFLEKEKGSGSTGDALYRKVALSGEPHKQSNIESGGC